jgi:DNA-binding XRE family transcriptional regulator
VARNHLPNGEKVGRLRADRGWTQEKLAENADINKRTVERIEAGDATTLTTLRVVAEALGVEVKELLATTGDQEAKAPPPPPSPPDSPPPPRPPASFTRRDITLSAPDSRQLVELLVVVLTRPELEKLAQAILGYDLLAQTESVPEAASELVAYASAHGRVSELLAVARASRPQNEELRLFVARLHGGSEPTLARERIPAEPASLPDLCERIAAVNPFLDNRINAPSTVDVDVSGIHQPAFERLVELARLVHSARRGLGVVLWGEAGIGKSHLLSRLGRWAAEGNASFAYLHNLQADPERLPRSLLNAVLGLLTLDRRNAFHATPLYDLLDTTVRAAVGPDVNFLRWSQLEQAYHAHADRQARPAVIGASRLDRTVHEVLFRFFRSAQRARRGKEDGLAAALAVRWLAGRGLDPAEARTLGLPPAPRRDEPVALEDAQQIKQVLVALARLAAAKGQPFVLAFDQVDNLEPEQFAALGRFLEALLDSADDLLVITAGIQSTLLRWREERVVQDSAWDRLGQFEVGLHRLTLPEADSVVRARLDAFLAPFTPLSSLAELRQTDPLFPLGRSWHQHFLADHVEIRPRDVVNWGREGWRAEQLELKLQGATAWLEGWLARQGGGVPLPPGPDPPPPTEAEVRAAIDRKVDEKMAAHRESRERQPGSLPPDADRLAAILADLLEQCRDADHLHGVLEVDRLPPPRRGVRPTYDLLLRRHLGEGRLVSTGVLVVTAENAVSVAGFLRRLSEDARPLDRLVLLTDERIGLPLGDKGQDYLEELRQRGPERFLSLELNFAEVVELEALQVVVRQAAGGDVEIEPRPGAPRAVRPEEVVASHQRRDRYLEPRLLRALLAGEAPPESRAST